MVREAVRLGVIGGSGLYALGESGEEVWPNTPYGRPSDPIRLTQVGGQAVAFLPRHGRDHTIPPHEINFRANLFALSSLGVKRVIGPCAVGSLRPELEPGSVVICDQFVDRTRGRRDTFFDGPNVAHLSAADRSRLAPHARRVFRLPTRAQWSSCKGRGSPPGPSRNGSNGWVLTSSG
jgi:5'-methylthioadenosine phosphorylase